MYVAINPYSKYVYRNIAIPINVTCIYICIDICLTRSLKNPYQGQFNINVRIVICIRSNKANPYLKAYLHL